METLAIGIKDFKDYLSYDNYYYVDKTSFIKDLVFKNSSQFDINLILRPRGFGKTLNQSMLRCFFDPKEEACKPLFKDLEISKDKEFCERLQNKVPVIFIKFEDFDSTSFDGLMHSLLKCISKEFVRHYETKEFLDTQTEKERFENFANCKAPYYDICFSVYLLSKTLFKFYNINPIVLIDNHDEPLKKACLCESCDIFYDYFHGIFHTGLKDNPYCGGAVITGSLRLPQGGFISGFDNALVNDVRMCNYYTTAFGFTKNEMSKMLADLNLLDKEAEITNWYGGYNFSDEEIYNPFSVCNYVSELLKNPNKRPEFYGSNTCDNAIFDKVFSTCTRDSSFKDKIEALVNGASVETAYSTIMLYSNMFENEKAIFGTLLFTGYLTLDTDGKLYVPNKEVLSTFKMLVDDYHKVLANSVSFNILNAFVEKDVKKISRYVSDVLFKSISVLDLGNNKEYSYHMLLTGMISVVASEEWTIKSNVESGNGFADIIIQNASTGIAIILELKVATSREEMLTKLDQADTYYGEDLIKQGYDVTRYAICFFKKEVEVRLFEDE